ncbi:hypothetical protein [Micromonospora sp. NPDC047134]|uniref:esterase/lipase family protein n=1 Tax=Micromonospora sp. NPDC047134 TaxID=3154340 RepID=UPI003400168F
MPLVYVHGIANRQESNGYEAKSELRDSLFQQFILPVIGDPRKAEIHSPYWGGQAGKLRWNGSSFSSAFGPAGRTLGAEDELGLALQAAATEDSTDPDRILLTIARRDLSDVVDVLSSVGPEPTEAQARDLAEAAGMLTAYVKRREAAVPDERDGDRYPWLDEVDDDVDMLDRLLTEATPPDQRQRFLGPGDAVRDWLSQARLRLRRGVAVVRGAPVTAMAGLLRLPIPGLMADMVGDIFTYLGQRGHVGAPGPIIERVLEYLDAAARERTPHRRLTVIAHSLGGVIAYDLLSHYRPDLVVDHLVTVGSQVGLFAELGLFQAVDRTLPRAAQPRIDPPPNIRHWINVVDRADFLAFRAEPIFRRVADYRYPSGAAWAHGAYLRQPFFHERLAACLARAMA